VASFKNVLHILDDFLKFINE